MEVPEFTRRDVLELLGVLGLGALVGCAPEETGRGPESIEEIPVAPREISVAVHTSNLRALIEHLLPGSLALGAERMLRIENLVLVLQAQGFLPSIRDDFLADGEFDGAFARLIEADLNILASTERPLAEFRELPADLLESAVRRGFEDPTRAPLLAFVRAACCLAFFGAVDSDQGLQQLGFPAFEDFESGVAVSGYPRMGPDGVLDDYTYNAAPAPTPGDDLTGVVDAFGDLA